LGIPSLATSLQLKNVAVDYLSHSLDFDFSVAAHFTRLVAAYMLRQPLPDDVDLLNLVIPFNATLNTPIRVTRMSKKRYFIPSSSRGKEKWEEMSKMDFSTTTADEETDPGTDVHAMIKERVVSVTPLSLDMTSRISLPDLDADIHRLLSELE
jgi:5'-nucleotidase